MLYSFCFFVLFVPNIQSVSSSSVAAVAVAACINLSNKFHRTLFTPVQLNVIVYCLVLFDFAQCSFQLITFASSTHS